MLIITRGAEHDELVSVVTGLVAAMQALTTTTIPPTGYGCSRPSLLLYGPYSLLTAAMPSPHPDPDPNPNQGEDHSGGPMSEGDESKLRSLVRQAIAYGHSLRP